MSADHTRTDHAHFAEWDAAYVLGALSPSERHEFEVHLEDCEKCRTAVAELSALPGLLGRLDHARAYALAETDYEPTATEPLPAPQGDLVARIRARERSHRRRRRFGMLGGLAAAAALASVLTLVIPQLIAPRSPAIVGSALTSVSDAVPIDATVELTEADWGTRIDLECSYHPGAGGYGPVEYSLWAVGRDGTERALSSWMADPDSTVKVSAGTALVFTDIRDIELRSADGSRTLMTARFG